MYSKPPSTTYTPPRQNALGSSLREVCTLFVCPAAFRENVQMHMPYSAARAPRVHKGARGKPPLAKSGSLSNAAELVHVFANAPTGEVGSAARALQTQSRQARLPGGSGGGGGAHRLTGRARRRRKERGMVIWIARAG